MYRITLILFVYLTFISASLLHAQRATYLGLEGGAVTALSGMKDEGGLIDHPRLSDRLSFYTGIQLMTPMGQKYMIQLTYAGIYKNAGYDFKTRRETSIIAGVNVVDSRDVGIRLMRKIKINDRFTLLPLAGIRLQFTGPSRSSGDWTDEQEIPRPTPSGNTDTMTVQRNRKNYDGNFNVAVELGVQLNYTLFSERFLLYTRFQMLQGLFLADQQKVRYTSQELGETNTASLNYRGSGLFLDFGVAYRIFTWGKDE